MEDIACHAENVERTYKEQRDTDIKIYRERGVRAHERGDRSERTTHRGQQRGRGRDTQNNNKYKYIYIYINV